MFSSKYTVATGEGGPSTPVTILAAGTGSTKNRIYKVTFTANGASSLVISDGFGTYNIVEGVPVVLDFTPFGRIQDTADTLISVTPSSPITIGALVQYEDR